jgi:Heterokaryon incompatibility protein (HET)
MAQIYKHGLRTLIWLGPTWDDSGVDAAISAIKDANRYVLSQYNNMDKSRDRSPYNTMHRIPAPGWILTSRNDQFLQVKKLLSKSWFYRVWVLQEVGVSSRVIAFCGQHSINFSEVVLFADVYNGTHIFRSQSNGESGKEETMLECCSLISWAFSAVFSTYQTFAHWLNELPLLHKIATYQCQLSQNRLPQTFLVCDILHTTRRFLASDPRDHLYAFLGHPAIGNILDPDHTLELDQMHLKLSTEIVRQNSSLDLFCYVDNTQEDMSSSHPSWVPQWHKQCSRPVIFRHEWNCLAAFSEEQDVKIVVQGSQLHAVGFMLDKIIDVSETVFSTDWITYGRAPGKRHIVEALWDVFSTRQKKKRRMTEFQLWSSFITTLVAGSYFRSDMLCIDFIAFCRQYCDPAFYNLAIRGITSARIDDRIQADPDRFRHFASGSLHWQKLFATENGLCGIAPCVLRRGDVVAMLFGCIVPLVLRPTSEKSYYKLVGWCFIDELMYGESTPAVLNRGRSSWPWSLAQPRIRMEKIVLV